MLIDSLIFEKGCTDFSPQLVCISAILFVVKFERDYNDNMYSFFKFMSNKLKILPTDVYKCESYILMNLPDNFGVMVGFSEVMKSFICVLELNSATEAESKSMSQAVVSAYIKAEGKMSVDSLLISLVLKAFFPKNVIEKKKLKIANYLKHSSEKEKLNKELGKLGNCKKVHLLAEGGLVVI
jgi:hypothetical protein